MDYEAAFAPRLPRRTALNRLNRLRVVGWIDRHGETRATIYHLTNVVRAKLEAEPAGTYAWHICQRLVLLVALFGQVNRAACLG